MKRRSKRKMKKFFAKNELTIFVALIIVALFSVTGAYAMLSKEVTVTGTGEITGEFASSGGTCPFEMTHTVAHAWGNTTMVHVTFTNISEWNWKSYMITMGNINMLTNFYGPFRSITTASDGNTYVMFPYAYKLPLNAGESVTYEMQIETAGNYMDILNTIDIPNCGQDNPYGELLVSGGASLHLNKYEKELPTKVSVFKLNDWNGDVFEISITNNTQNDIYDWRLIVYFGSEKYVSSYGINGLELIIEKNRVIGNGTDTLLAGQTVTFYLVLDTDDTYIPDMVGAGSQP